MGQLRGKMLVALLDGGEPKMVYTRDDTQIRDRVMFPLMPADHDWVGGFL